MIFISKQRKRGSTCETKRLDGTVAVLNDDETSRTNKNIFSHPPTSVQVRRVEQVSTVLASITLPNTKKVKLLGKTAQVGEVNLCSLWNFCSLQTSSNN